MSTHHPAFGPRPSDLGSRTSDLVSVPSALIPASSDLGPRTSDVVPVPSALVPAPSDLGSRTSDLDVSKSSLHRFIELAEKHGNVGGALLMFQPGATPDGLPFEIKKVLYMTDIREDHVRGGHAHFETEEVLVCLRGACTVDLDDGCGRTESVRLDRRDRALLLYPHVWRVVRDFAPGTDLLAVAGHVYDEKDYIRSRARFEELAPGWSGSLGSSAPERNS